MGFSFNRISDFFVVVVVVIVVQEVLHERGFSELGASRAKDWACKLCNLFDIVRRCCLVVERR